MPFAQRTLENNSLRLLENLTLARALECASEDSEQVSLVYPKTDYAWTDRLNITVPDVSGTYSLAGIIPSPTADAGNLVVAIDGNLPSMTIGVAVVYWDERGNPVAVSSANAVLSGWCANAAGNYILANGFGLPPGFIVANVSMAAGYTVLITSIQPAGGVINLHTRLF